MHDPVRAIPARGAAVVVHQRLLVPHGPAAVADGAVLPRGLPVPFGGGAARARAVRVLAVQTAAEEPLLVPRPQRRPLGEVGGVGLVDVDVGDVGGRAAGGDPALEEIEDELLIGGAEAEARRPPGRRVLHFRLFRRRGGEIGWWTCPWIGRAHV